MSSLPPSAQRARASLAVWLTVAWLALALAFLIFGAYSARSYAATTDDVNLSGQLRYRTLLLRETLRLRQFEDAQLAATKMREIHTALEARHPSQRYFAEPEFATLMAFAERSEAPSLEEALRHVDSADRLVTALAESARSELRNALVSLSAMFLMLLLAVVMLLRANLRLQRTEERLVQLAATDGLTQVWNRRKLYQVLESMHASPKTRAPFAIVLADIDHFKAINDEFGHAQGDTVLVAFAALYREMNGQLFRYGGEEFAWVLPNFDLEDALLQAEVMRKMLIDAPLAGSDVTASFGVASARAGESPTATLERADRALYTAKNLGRNRVVSEKQAPRSLVPGAKPA
jgi:diguanylate cyclase (GGDEF)-like protein